ncbi:MAG: polyprenyl synthetase family protein [Bacteroidia bacterium]
MTDFAALKSRVESHLQAYALGERQPLNLYAPMAYILALKGKRIRPLLVLMAYQAASRQDPGRALDLACAAELFHNFTLMHDDIMDAAPVRRGQPTVHMRWDENTAILSGDALFAYAMELVVRGFPDKAAALAIEFSRVSMAVCEGQMEDMDLAARQEVQIPEYIEMIRKKTAALLGGCLSLGALAAGAPTAVVEAFRQYGEQLGIAFQLQDDLMDAFPPEGFGKQTGGDIIENKKTYLYLRALACADTDDAARLRSLFATRGEVPGKVEAVLDIFRRCDIEAQTRALIEDYFAQAQTTGQTLAAQVAFDPIKAYLREIAQREV